MDTAADAIVRALAANGGEYVFGVPGDTSIDWYRALQRHAHLITHVLAADERGASFMADAYARFTGKPGICEGPSGAGVSYLLPGAGEANRSGVPLIAMNTGVPMGRSDRGMLTEIDQNGIFQTEVKWSTSLCRPQDALDLINRAFRISSAGKPGAVHIALPCDVLRTKLAVPPVPLRQEIRCPLYRYVPEIQAVHEAADAIQAAKRPVLVAGGGIHSSRAYAELQVFAELISALVATSISGKGSISEDHPLSIGCVGENGAAEPANRALAESDFVMFVGSETGSVVTSKWTLPAPDRSQVILHLDIDPETAGKNYHNSLALVGDARATLSLLTKALRDRGHTSDAETIRFAEALAGEVTTWRRSTDCSSDCSPMHGACVVREFRNLLPTETVIVSDAGTPTPFFAAYYQFPKAGRYYANPRAHGGLGYAVPAAVGAALARPQNPVVALTGDGSLLMSLGELATIVRLGMHIMVVVFHNNEYSWIAKSQTVHDAAPPFDTSFADVDYAQLAESFGMHATHAKNRSELRRAIRESLDHKRPSLIDVKTASLCDDLPPVAPWACSV